MIAKNKVLGTISPSLTTSDFHAATGGTDVIFDWTPLVIPRGACTITSIGGTIMGINGAAGNGNDFRLYFAKSIDEVAPSSFGTAHAAQGVNQAAGFRRNILGALFVDMSAIDDADNLIAYNVFQTKLVNASSTSGEFRGAQITLEGEPNITRDGFQTIYVAMEAAGSAFDFGTDVDLNQVGNQAASTEPVQITVSGTDPRLVFQPGDIIGGSTGTVEMEVVSVDSSTTMTVKNITAQIDHTEQLIIKNPITINFGLEY